MLTRSVFLALFGAAATAPRDTAATPPVALGDDLFVRENWRDLAGRTVGIVTNQSGVTSWGEPFVDAVRRNTNISVKALFAPEHGIRGVAAAGAGVASSVDARTGLPIHSLYGKNRRPTREMLEGIDVLLFDIQDVGARTYTYVSTMAYVMQAARAFDKEVWILDRPNPAGGEIVEGPVLDPAFSSFIGLYPVAMRHGMTVGELASLYNDRFGIGCNLRVIAMRNYRRSMLWGDTRLSWIPTSPNIPTWQTALVYPATGLGSEAGINNATGDVVPFKPFFLAGAYGLNGATFANALNAAGLQGIRFDPARWTPRSGFWAEKTLTGSALTITDPKRFRSVRTAVQILVALRTTAPRFLHVNPEKLDRDWGTDTLRTGLERGLSGEAISAQWTDDVRAFEALRKPYLLYPA